MSTLPAAAPPRFVADRCVHMHADVATCRSCAAACPRDAVILDAAALLLDESGCDGCGVCVAACPQEAIEIDGGCPTRGRVDGPHWFAACPAAGVTALGEVPCLHAIGLGALVDARDAGMRKLLVARGDCADCPRNAAKTLHDHVEDFNRLAAAHGTAEVELIVVSQRFYDEHGPRDVAFASRRIERYEPGSGEPPPWRPAASRLRGAGCGGLAMYVPQVDDRRCTGCDACAELCPTEALSVDRGESCDALISSPGACSGCGLCVDVCAEASAISVASWLEDGERVVVLERRRCPGCGAPFHEPAPSTSELCRVCQAAPHFRRLFQTL